MTPEQINEGSILLVDKPLDWTSFDAVNYLRHRIRRFTGNKKIKVGHAGTLDPRATGLLVICTGKFTRRIDELQAQSKVYTGTFKLGATTPCYDTEQPEDAWFPTEHITPELIKEATLPFIGDIEQIPPAHSAIKVDGKALYKSARQGEIVEVKPRPVTIYRFEITGIDMPLVHFEIECSKGTYIRSIAYDFGKALNSGGYLTALRRTRSGDFNVADALTPEVYAQQFTTES